MRIRYLGLSVAIALAATPATAERIELREKDMTAVDPSTAYVLMTAEDSGAMQIFRKASQKEADEWEIKRGAAHKRAVKAYESDLKAWRNRENDPFTGRPYRKPDPVETSFYFKPPELANFVNVLGREYIKGENYILLRLDPGDYVFYTVPGKGTGVARQGQCLCMGSIGFTAEAGKVVSVGRFSGMVNDGEYRFIPAAAADPVPQSLQRFGVTPARLFGVGKLPNFLGSIVARVGSVPGLIDYQRDLPLDGSGRPAAGLR